MEDNFNSLVSFCVYGNCKDYIEILKTNFTLLTSNNYKVVIFCEKENIDLISSNIADSLVMDGTIMGIKNKMLWRLNPVFLNLANNLFVRDADSIITNRELQLMNDFINSKYEFHIIRDHPLHYMPIMGGLFGMKSSIYDLFYEPDIFHKMKVCKNLYNYDQYFLSDVIYPIIKNKALIHTSSYSYKFENIQKISVVSEYCGKYANSEIAKFDQSNDHLGLVNRSPSFYLLAKVLRYKWFLFIRKNG